LEIWLQVPDRRNSSTGSFDWTVEDVFLPELRTVPQVGVPLENQSSVGPHHSAVISGIARSGLNALIELAGGKQPRDHPAGLLCDSPQIQDAVGLLQAHHGAAGHDRMALAVLREPEQLEELEMEF
jgi:indole-3-acetate monooxygenase